MILCPSIASANPMDLKGEIARLGKQNRNLHIDIEDGTYIPNITFGLRTVEAIVRSSPADCDVHITAVDPERFIDPLAEMGIVAVCAHFELIEHPLRFLNHAKKQGMRAGIALSFQTSPQQLEMFTDRLDYVLVMTAEPDFEDEQFWPPALDKIRTTRRLMPDHVSIWADGGIDARMLPEVLKSGADTVVMGRAVWGRKDAEAAMEEYYKIAGNSF